MSGVRDIGIHTAPWGRCEDGVLITEHDAVEIGQHHACTVEQVVCTNGTHRVFIKSAPEACATIVIFCGGQGQVYVQPDLDYPDKLIFPLTTVNAWRQHNINVVVVDQSYPLPWGWQKLVGVADFNRLLKYIICSNKPISQQHRDTKVELAVACFIKDMQDIIAFVNHKFPVPIVLAGHCGSAVSVVMFAELHPEYASGLVLWSPFRPLRCDRFVPSTIKVPILVTQHRGDRCENTTPAVAKSVVAECTNGIYVELDGGIDQGHKDFSIGYHGYRGIEEQLATETAKFVHKYL